MRSVTSCFNSTLYRKTMARFWPLWALYTLFWMFSIPLLLLNNYFWDLPGTDSAYVQSQLYNSCLRIPRMLQWGTTLACFMAVLCAMAVFGYLYSHRSAAMIHSLPMKRETLFFTQYAAGLSFMLLPNLAVAGLTAGIELLLLPTMYWGAALKALLLWLLVQSGLCLFFFSFAALCAMFTGHSLALPAFYGIFNILVLVIHSLIMLVASSFLYGFPSYMENPTLVRLLTPVWALTESCSWGYEYNSDGLITSTFLSSPATVAGYAVAGVVMALIALLVYRYRHVESAGDVVAIALVRPVFLVGVSFCTGLCFGWCTALFFSWDGELSLTVCVLLWTVIGWFAAEMLLKKSFRVLHTWKGALVMTLAVALLCGSFLLDVFGIENRIPNAADVEYVRINSGDGYPQDDGKLNCVVDEQAQIAKVIATHRAILDTKDTFEDHFEDDNQGYFYFDVTYVMKNGSTLVRNYIVPISEKDINQEGTVTWCANQLLQDRTIAAQCYNFAFYADLLPFGMELNRVWNTKTEQPDSIYPDTVPGADLTGLWQAVQKDFAEGTIGVRYLLEGKEYLQNTYATDLTLSMASQSSSSSPYFSIILTPTAKNTLAWLEEKNILGDTYRFMTHADDDLQVKADEVVYEEYDPFFSHAIG